MTMLSFIQDAAQPDLADISQLVQLLIDSVQNQQWGVLAAAIMMVLVWGVTKLPMVKDIFKGPVALWVGAVSSVVSAFAVGFLTTSNWLTATVSALTAAAGGSLLVLVSRAISGKPIDADGDGKLDPLDEKAETPAESDTPDAE